MAIFLPGRRVSGPAVAPAIPLVTQTYGSIIPISAGQRAIVGKVIWADEFKRASGNTLAALPMTPIKRQPETYLATFAVAFGYQLVPNSNVLIGRVWLDWGEGFILAYDAITDQPVSLAGLNFKLYDGTTTQTPDPLISDDKGELTPGFHNLIYAVFTDFPVPTLTLPVVKAELYGSDSIEDIYEPFDNLSPSTPTESLNSFVDWSTREFWTWADSDTTSPVLVQFNIDDREEIKRLNIGALDPASDGFNTDITLYDRLLRVVFRTESPVTNSVPLTMINVNSGAIAARFGTHSTDLDTDEDSIAYPTKGGLAKLYPPGGGSFVNVMMLGSFISNELTLFSYTASEITFIRTDDLGTGSSRIKTIVPIKVWELDGFTDKLKAAGQVQQDASFLVGFDNELRLYNVGIRDGAPEIVGTHTLKTYTAGHNVVQIVVDLNGRFVSVITYDLTDAIMHTYELQLARADFVEGFDYYRGLCPFLLERAPTIGGYSHDHLPNSNTDSVPYFEGEIPAIDNSGNRGDNIIRMSQAMRSKFGYQSGAIAKIVDMRTGEIDSHPVSQLSGTQEIIYDTLLNAFLITGTGLGTINPAWVLLDRPAADALTLDVVLRHLARLAGYSIQSPNQVEIDASIIDPVLGIVIDKVWDTSTLFRSMGRVYDFQVFESEGVIKFKRAPKGQGITEDVTLTIDNLAPINEGDAQETESLLTTFGAPSDTPVTIALTYIDPDLDYQQQKQSFSDTDSLQDATSISVDEIEIPIVMESQEAYERTSKIALTSKELSITQQFRLPWAYGRVEPADTARITIEPFEYIVQITEVAFNADWSLSISARNYGFRDDVTVDSDGNLGDLPDLNTSGQSASIVVVLDMPYITAAHDASALPTLYVGAASYGQENWSGATIWRAKGQASFEPQYDTTVSVVYGTIAGTVPETDYPFQSDLVNTLEITVANGSEFFADCTLAEFWAGANAIVIGKPDRWELIYFRLALITNHNTVELFGLLRGRRGTEVNCNNHEPGDECYLVRSVADGFEPSLSQLPFDASDLGASYRYKAVGNGLSDGVEKAETFESNALKPFAPCNVKIESGIISWARRTRLDYSLDTMCGFPNDVPLAEASELYEVDIIEGSEVIATLTSSTPSIAYPFSPVPESVTLRVYQVSAVVGRGFTQERTVAPS